MLFAVGKDIRVYAPTDEFRQWCKSELVINNPEYIKKVRFGKWLGDTPKTISLYEDTPGVTIVPFGMLKTLFQRYGSNNQFKPEFEAIRAVDYKSSINLYDYQKKAIEKAIEAKNGVIVMPCGAGKGLPIDAKICTPTGWRRNGDLQVGDAVVGSDGKSTRVTGIFDRGKVDAYKITFSDGVETVCDKDHLWTVQKQSQRAESRNWDVMNTQAIYEHYQNMKCRSQYLYIPIVKPVEFYGYEDYRSMNPWLLGFLLGDGCFQKSMITMSTSEDDILKKVIDIIGKDYGACEWIIHKKNYDWRFCGGYTLHDIKSLGLECKHSYEKFIPKEYLFAPIDVRLAVLRGLFDADGHISNGTIYEYSTASKQLADDVVFIVESLGGTAKVKEKIPTYTYNGEKRTGRKAYRVFFKLYNFKPFTSEKHSAAYRNRAHYNKAYRIIKKIEPCEPITSRCITVDAEDQLYVTEHFVVTHNTQTALELVARIGGRCLWLTHTQDLLNQSMNRAKSCFGVPVKDFGTITSGKVNIQKITFATVQTMCNIDLPKYEKMFDVVIVDECHRCIGSPTRVMQFYKVLTSICARYKFGLTATPKRSDGLEKSMYSLLGGIVYEVSKDAVKNTTCPVKVITYKTGYIPNLDLVLSGDGTLNYSALVDDLIENEERFNFVGNIINRNTEGATLVLGNRVKYLQELCEYYDGKAVCLSAMGNSRSAKEERKNVLKQLNNGEIDCVFATYQLAKEGLDVPNLRYIVFVTPEKDPTTIEQSTGRVGRKADGKSYGTVIDFVDEFGMYKGWQKKRLSVYKKIGCDIIE